MSKEITFIIPNRGGKNIDFIIEKLKELYKESKFIVITQDDDKPFCRGQLFNIGYNFTETDYMCFIDNDMFFPKYIDLISEYNKLNCVALQPFTNILQVKIDKNNGSYIVTEDARKIDSAKGGVTFISKENFEKVNGMSNLYVGWGREDNEFDCRGEIKDINEKICHISHIRRNNETINYRLNRKYFSERNNRQIEKDGYKNTKYNVTKDEIINNVRYVYANNIYVNDNFLYKELLDKHYK